ncbi:hypothetical protein ACC839_34555, partial [Rhizobium ruizarguesonis]
LISAPTHVGKHGHQPSATPLPWTRSAFEMTDRMPLAELAGPVRIELYNIFMYQGVNVSCSGVELHRQLFHARPAQDH